MEDGEHVTNFNFQYFVNEGEVIIIFSGLEVLRVTLNAENLASGLFEQIKNGPRFLHLPEEQRAEVYEKVRERLAEEGVHVSDEEISKYQENAVKVLELKLLRESCETSRKVTSEKFAEVVFAFWEKLLNIASFAGANALRDHLNVPEQKYSNKAIEAALYRLERERLKALIGEVTTRGGAHNVKHLWTDEERAQLATKYEELRPIWIEAKRIARDAQKSRERTRKKEWRAEVLRAYPHLPADLLERFSNPRADDAKPADIAVIHAKRECGITEEYSPRHLREQIKAWKLKASS